MRRLVARWWNRRVTPGAVHWHFLPWPKTHQHDPYPR